MQVRFAYHRGYIEFSLSSKNLIQEIKSNPLGSPPSEAACLKQALKAPYGTAPLRNIVRPGEKVVIVTSDITRPMPSERVLPFVLQELQAGGIQLKDISVVLARGIHRAHTTKEKEALVGKSLLEQVKVLDSQVDDCIFLGRTQQGTPVEIFRPVVEADRRICLGNIEYHYFAGYSGGVKAIMPGVSTRAAIQQNHRLMLQGLAQAGSIEGNPVRLDLEEAIRYIPIDFLLNVVLDEEKRILQAFAGDYLLAHRAGCHYLDQLYRVDIQQLADIVLTSPGGYPKDINLYQAQKALANAQYAVRPGGIIVLVAACREGLGDPTFEKWMQKATSPKQLMDKLTQNFELGGHKAAAFAKIMDKNPVYLVSDLEPSLVKSFFMEPFADVDGAMQHAFAQVGPTARVITMPFGSSTLPRYREPK